MLVCLNIGVGNYIYQRGRVDIGEKESESGQKRNMKIGQGYRSIFRFKEIVDELAS